MEGFDGSLRVGEQAAIKKSFFATAISMTYAGMPSPDVFSVAVFWRQGNQAAAWNLFYPSTRRGFDLAGGHVTVTHVDAESMRFRFEK